MLHYSQHLKEKARELRGTMTDAEQMLWQRLRRKQMNGWQFYRQKPIGPYIVDFYCPAAKLIVEVDGSQHLAPRHRPADRVRTTFLEKLGLRVLRFDNRQVLLETEAVVAAIAEIPPPPLWNKGGTKYAPSPPPAISNESAPLMKTGKRTTLNPNRSPLPNRQQSYPPLNKGGRGGISRPATAGEQIPDENNNLPGRE